MYYDFETKAYAVLLTDVIFFLSFDRCHGIVLFGEKFMNKQITTNDEELILKTERKELFNLKKFFCVLLGNTVYAVGIAAFVLPNSMMTGGTTGLGLVLEHFFQVPVTLTVAVFNIAMFTLAVLFLGKAFALTAVISTFYFPFILGQVQRISYFGHITNDYMLSAVAGGAMIGFGIGLVIKAGASTGGMDIPPLILHKKFGFSISKGLYLFDFVILLMQLLFSNAEKILYGILLVCIYTVIVDKILVTGKSQIKVEIISEAYEEINQMIQSKIDRGTTLLRTESGFMRKDTMTVMTVISNREFPKLNQMILEIDPKAFLIVCQVQEVMGRGFTLKKKARVTQEQFGPSVDEAKKTL